MAFKMNRSVIKGTTQHKKSIAQAKSVVSQQRIKPDATLVQAGQALGRSYIPHAIDYSLDTNFATPPDSDSKKKKDKKELDIKKLPTKEKEAKLRKATGTVETKEHKDKFFEAAKKAGIDIKTPEDYEKAERILIYDEKIDNWREKVGSVTDTSAEFMVGDATESVDVYQQKIDAGRNYGVIADDMISDGKGGYVPKEGAKSRYGDTWDSKIGGWRDDAPEQYYGPEGQKISKETADKLAEQQQIKVDKRTELEEKNRLIREKNALIRAFKEEYPDRRVTQTALDEYKDEIKTREELSDLDLEEEDSLDWWEEEQQKRLEEKKLEQESYKPKVLSDEPTAYTSGQLRRLDKKWEESGPSVRQNMRNDGYTPKNERSNTSAMQMRDDRIWKFAKKGSAVHKNMRKSGYIPPDER